MNKKELSISITEFSSSKNIDRSTLIDMLKEMFFSLIEKRYGTKENFEIKIKPEKGELDIYRYRVVVADDAQDIDQNTQIPLREARKIMPDFEVGEEVDEPIGLQAFDRRDITQGLQVFLKKKQEVEKMRLYSYYKELLGKIVHVEVYHTNPNTAILFDEQRNELYLPKQNQIPRENIHEGNHIWALVEEVVPLANRVKIILSRKSPLFLAQLLVNHIPEVKDGLIQIKKVARIPGERAKVVVSTEYDQINPVTAFIGVGGNRITSLSKKELYNEQINVVQYTDNEKLLLERLLKPAEITSIEEEDGELIVKMDTDQVPLAIGKRGQNIHLATQIIGKRIQIVRENRGEEDIYLDKFADAIDPKLIEKIKAIGIETAKEVLRGNAEDLCRRTGISTEELHHLKEVINQEFES